MTVREADNPSMPSMRLMALQVNTKTRIVRGAPQAHLYFSLDSRAHQEEHNDGGQEHPGYKGDAAKTWNRLVMDFTAVGLIVNVVFETELGDRWDGDKSAPHADQYSSQI